MNLALAAVRAIQQEIDRASWRAIERCAVGEITPSALDDVLALNARLWTRAANEIAGLQDRPVYQEDDVAPTVF